VVAVALGRAGVDVNAVVSFNVKAIRERRSMTQQAVADRLAELTGHQLPQASISAMERGFNGERRRRFDAHELYLLSVVFDVPIAYFFIPPPGTTSTELADTRRPVAELWRSTLGTDAQLEAVDARLAEFASKVKALGPAGYLRSASHRTGEPVEIEEEEA
jgi:transcriptional regulator with XRE-family HTH domain